MSALAEVSVDAHRRAVFTYLEQIVPGTPDLQTNDDN